MSLNLSKKIISLFFILFTLKSFAGGPNNFSYEGRVYDSNGLPSTQIVSFLVQIYNPAGNCLLRSEQSANIDLSQTDSYFSVSVGGGTAASGDPGLSFTQIFSNQSTITGSSSCTYTPVAGDGRLLRISVVNNGATTAMTPDIPIGSTPYAVVADSVQGLTPSKLLQVNTTAPVVLSQSNLESVFSGANYTTLQSLLAGNYVTKVANGTESLPPFASAPSSPAAGNMWYDTTSNQIKFYNGSSTQTLAAGSGISSLNGLAAASQTFSNDVNVTVSSASTTHTLGWTGTLAMVRGGTSAPLSPTNGGAVYSTASALAITPPGSVGQVLTSNGPSAPTWASIPPDPTSFKNNGNAFAAASVLGTNDNYSLSFKTNNINRLILDNLGNVGIGTASPQAPFEVVSGSQPAAQFSSATSPIIRLNNTSGTNETGGIIFGLPGPTQKWKIGTDYNNNNGHNFYIYDSANAALGLFIAGGAAPKIGIGTATPAYPLDVVGDINLTTSFRISGTQICSISGCTAVSDRRLKENISPLANSLDKLLQLQGVEYDWKDKKKFGDKHQIGFIAQDLEKIYPEVVVTDSLTGLKSVAYDHLIAPMIEAIKEFHSEILGLMVASEKISMEMASLQAALHIKDEKINQLEAENAAIKSYLCSKDPTAAICKN